MAYKQPWESTTYDPASPLHPYPQQPTWQQQSPAYPQQPAWQQGSGVGNYPPSSGRPFLDQYGNPTTKSSQQRWQPRTWTRRTKLIVIAASVILLLIIVIVAAVEGVRANRYPDYSHLQYSQVASYAPENFFDNFDYWDTADPANGFVHYDNPIDAVNRNLTYSSSTSAILRVDNSQTDETSTNAITGRHSARVYSKTTWNDGLFLFDVLHSPYGCGSWPALWLSDQYNWPNNGEIDIIESVNQGNDSNQMTLHTTGGCSMSVKRKDTGKSLQSDCHNTTNANNGCGVQGSVATFGKDLNDNGGGVYATELRSAGIRIWFFPRANLPSDVSSAISSTSTAAPDPSTWGEALADFPSTDCDVGSHFKNQTIIVNIDVCGSWAGRANVYSNEDKCPGICTKYATTNPSNFDNAYWEFGAFKVYQAPGA
ncbi:MAG: hypothetical protein M1828_005046 [Chrysothrix sp. TS-e1954]|nr:MAG: hypothetical protein M1828_005046 [Chrysothrix sp. TS-e1954]